VDHVNVKCLDNNTLAEIEADNKVRSNLFENKRLKVINKTYRETKTNQTYKKGGPKWQNKKMK
jgi:hypothetical protein